MGLLASFALSIYNDMRPFQLAVLLLFLGLCARFVVQHLSCEMFLLFLAAHPKSVCVCCFIVRFEVQRRCTLYCGRNASSILLINQERVHTEDTTKLVSENCAGV